MDGILILLALKYGAYYNGKFGVYDILGAILEKSQLLDLAHCMQMTRNDWRDGFDSVSYALARFKPSDERGLEIKKDVEWMCEPPQEDGRVFRDCRWNYNELFKIVYKESQQLYRDYVVAVNNLPPW